ncbi:uncharacterized protein LOC110914591 [Helianthus annuus]|uniref:uncharacterized protein LOC110914591 n=1 Tax=Helianthus annuus TaxID=4232 RepID=UPI000B904E37|nr:uncharacterized protein LOC110914591 [Helianthus annuus]
MWVFQYARRYLHFSHHWAYGLEDEDKSAFVTNEGLFCYTKMPFGLKNAEATYQRLMDKAFKDQIGRNLEIYVDDLVIKSQAGDNMIDDILETFTRLRGINLNLNPKKCSFGLEEGKFLGVWITQSRIQAHLDKIKAVISMQPPKTVKEIQSLNGKLELKVCLGSLPTLTAPITGETVTVYLSASHFAISAVLVVHRKQAQIPVYYAFNIEVQTDLQIQQILKKPEVSGRLTKWATELSAFDIVYRTRGLVKGQVVADFLTEVPTGESTKEKSALPRVWNLYTDGASSKEGAGAEYEALLAGLQTAAKAGATSVLAHVDSLLVANQVNPEYEAREENMTRYLSQVNSLISSFDSCKVVHIPRSKNKKADALCKLASVAFCHLSKEVLVETLQAPAIQQMESVMSISVQERS